MILKKQIHFLKEVWYKSKEQDNKIWIEDFDRYFSDYKRLRLSLLNLNYYTFKNVCEGG